MTTMHGYGNVLAAGSTLLALSCGSGSDDTNSGGGDALPIPPELEWFACTEPELVDTECATLAVPLDYENPGGDTIQIALSRVAAADPTRRIGPMLANPGGPGAPGRSQAPGWRDYLVANDPVVANAPEVLARFDLIGFDPRGILASTAVDCGDVRAYRAVDWTPDDDAEREALERTMREFAAACEEHSGPILEFVDSYSVARDMDQIRRALREEKISYWGGSYGTVLGTAYAELFPERVRAFVLEAAIRPNVDGAGYAREFAQNWERAFDALAADCAARPECAARFGGDIRSVFDRAVEKLATTPLVDPVTGETMNESLVAYVVGNLFGSLPESGALEQFIEDADAGNGRFVGGVLQGVQNFAETIVPFLCADRGFPDPAVAYSELLPELLAAAPRFGHAQLPAILPCAHWPTKPRQHPPPHAKGAPPILVIGGTGDGTTAYWWSEQLAAELESGVLLTRVGVGHGAFSQCAYEAAYAYLLDLTVPAPGTSCPTP